MPLHRLRKDMTWHRPGGPKASGTLLLLYYHKILIYILVLGITQLNQFYPNTQFLMFRE